MKVLTAGAGDRPDDFAWTVPGEVVYFAEVCARDEHGDGGCGCGRAFAGVVTGRATSVAVVADLAMDRDDLAAMLADHLVHAGWSGIGVLARELAEEVAEHAGDHPEGTRLRRDAGRVVPA